MTKNTEWGSVAYLQHSKYGSMASVRINNSDNLTGYAAVNEPTCGYTGDNRDCNKYGIEASVTQPWNTDIGYLASTTGNISGVYDMSGGTWEYMMAFLKSENGQLIIGTNSQLNSGFNGIFSCPTCAGDTSGLTTLTNGYVIPTDARYYDVYDYSSTNENYQRRILGDATGEMGPFATAIYGTQNRPIGSWYGDGAKYSLHVIPFLLRGTDYSKGTESGVFAFDNNYGNSNANDGYRIVLSF